MGKPFERELELLPGTVTWAAGLDLKMLTELIGKYYHPVYIVGSGGSFSACVYAADLLTSRGIFAKAITPLELFYAKATIRKSNLIFISASGSNTDILFAFKKAIESEPVSVINICMREKTKLKALSANYSSCANFEFKPPSGKDGFLATNSLVAYFVILYKAIMFQPLKRMIDNLPTSFYLEFIERVNRNTCFTILYGSFHHAVAVDLESKLSEAGLAPSLLSDYRHFAHGRHQWFDKKEDSAIIALTCPGDIKLCQRTLELLPEKIPKLILNTSLDNFEGTIHLLIQAMDFIQLYGKKQGIDPGRPGVPDYGSKIYHLRYERLVSNTPSNQSDVSILRKTKVSKLTDLESTEYSEWKELYEAFVTKTKKAKFGSLICDYDGTLCSPFNRFTGMGDEVKSSLIKFLKKGFVLGVVSGRGVSLRNDLLKILDGHPELLKNVVVGYYNGSDIATLSNPEHPVKNVAMHVSLQIVKDKLLRMGLKSDDSPNQLTFGSKTTQEWTALKEVILNEMMLLNLRDITMVESSHSIDIIPRDIASKNNILTHCKRLSKSLGLSQEVLCIGDKGQWPGNDYALLANEYGLSVNEVSSLPETCWNICPPGLRDEKGVAYLFQKIKMEEGYFTLNTI